MAGLKTYYCVTSRFFSDGRMTASISANVKEYRCPSATYTSTPECDTYNDWFGSYIEANKFIKQTKELQEEMKASRQAPPDRSGFNRRI